MASEQQSLAEWEAQVIAEMKAQAPIDPALERFERRAFESRRRGRWNGWRRRADGSWEHRERPESSRVIRGGRHVDFIYDKFHDKLWPTRAFPFDVYADEVYPGDPDGIERLVQALGGEQEIPLDFGTSGDRFGKRRSSIHRRV